MVQIMRRDTLGLSCEEYLNPNCDIAGIGVYFYLFTSQVPRFAFQSISKACFLLSFYVFPMRKRLFKPPSETRFSLCTPLPLLYQ